MMRSDDIMQTLITERGQISIPADVRKKLHLKPGMGMEWVITEKGIYLFPVPENPVKSFRGSLKNRNLLDDLLLSRQKDRLKTKVS